MERREKKYKGCISQPVLHCIGKRQGRYHMTLKRHPLATCIAVTTAWMMGGSAMAMTDPASGDNASSDVKFNTAFIQALISRRTSMHFCKVTAWSPALIVSTSTSIGP